MGGLKIFISRSSLSKDANNCSKKKKKKEMDKDKENRKEFNFYHEGIFLSISSRPFQTTYITFYCYCLSENNSFRKYWY